MATPNPAPAVAPLPVAIIAEDFPEPELTDEEITELEMRLYYESHDDRAYWA